MRISALTLFILPFFGFSQQSIKGKIITETPDVSEIIIVNLNSESETKTDDFGRFIIKAKAGDLLVILAPHIYKKRHLVEESDFDAEINIEVESRTTVIDAVEINRYNYINSESLGIVPKGQKRYTQVERRLKTASDPNIQYSWLIPTIGFSLDPVINSISGKTRRLKKLVEMERENKRIAYLSGMFDQEFFTQNLQISSDNVEEFKFYALYHLEKDISEKQKDTYIRSFPKKELELKLISLSEMYLKLKKTE